VTTQTSNRGSGSPLDERILAAAVAAAEASTEHAEFRVRPAAMPRVFEPSRKPDKRRLLITCAFAVAACLLIATLIVALPNSRRNGTTSPAQKVNTRSSFQPASNPFIDFVSRSTGYVILVPNSSPSIVEKTVDGGIHWTPVYSIKSPLLGIDFANAEVGWAVGPSVLLSTKNGGASWHVLHQPPVGLVRVDFVTPLDGWGLTSTGVLFSTSNGGSWWHQVKTSGSIDSECLASPSQGWISGSNYVDATTNDGSSWSQQYSVPGNHSETAQTQLTCSGNSAAVAFNLSTGPGQSQIVVADAHGVPSGTSWLALSNFQDSIAQVIAPAGYITGVGSPDSTNVVVLSQCVSGCHTNHVYVGIIHVLGQLNGSASLSGKPLSLNVAGEIVTSAVSFGGQLDGWVSVVGYSNGAYTNYIYQSNGHTPQSSALKNPVLIATIRVP